MYEKCICQLSHLENNGSNKTVWQRMGSSKLGRFHECQVFRSHRNLVPSPICQWAAWTIKGVGILNSLLRVLWPAEFTSFSSHLGSSPLHVLTYICQAVGQKYGFWPGTYDPELIIMEPAFVFKRTLAFSQWHLKKLTLLRKKTW